MQQFVDAEARHRAERRAAVNDREVHDARVRQDESATWSQDDIHGIFFIRKAATQLNYVENSGASVEANRALPPTYNRNKMKPFIGD